MGKRITATEERDLIVRAQGGDNDAAAALLSAHEGYLTDLCKKFRRRWFDLEDLMQEARIAMLLLIPRFDPSRGVRFLPFATPKLNWTLRSYATRDHTIRCPSGSWQNPWLRGRLLAAQNALSLNAPISAENKAPLASAIEARDDVVSSIVAKEDVQRLRWAMDHLTPMERKIAQGRMNGMLMSEIGRAFRLTKQRISQIDIKAREKLKRIMESRSAA